MRILKTLRPTKMSVYSLINETKYDQAAFFQDKT